MPTSDNIPPQSLYTSPRYWLVNVGTAIIAGLVAAAVSSIASRLYSHEPEWLTVGIFFFVFSVLRPNYPGRRHQGWVSRVTFGLLAAAVAILVLGVLSNW